MTTSSTNIIHQQTQYIYPNYILYTQSTLQKMAILTELQKTTEKSADTKNGVLINLLYNLYIQRVWARGIQNQQLIM